MKRAMIALALAFSAGAGAAAAGTIENSFGNTVRVTTADGTLVLYRFKADGSFAMTTPDNVTTPGAWVVKDTQICLTPTGAAQTCSPYNSGKKVGDTWTEKDANGAPFTITMAAGQ